MSLSSAFRSAIAGALRSTVSAGRSALGLPARRSTEDRRVLEQVILPEYARRTEIRRVLFVGCASYTQPYENLFAHCEYWTIDPVAQRSRYGSRHHIVDRLENLGRHVAAGYFDLIVCNGVLGWGLNDATDAEAAFEACHLHLRDGGELVLGWNDTAPRNRVTPGDLAALALFEHQVFDPLQTSRLCVAGGHRHVFDFYRNCGKEITLSSGRKHMN